MGDQQTTRSLLVFAAGATIGGAIAFGAAYGFARHYASTLNEDSVPSQHRHRWGGGSSRVQPRRVMDRSLDE